MDDHHAGGGSGGGAEEIKEQDRLLPVANVGRIMKQILPPNAKISKEAKETMQECVSEFISFVTGEASDKCHKEKRKTVNGDDVCWAFVALGFDDYVDPMRRYLHKYRELEGDRAASSRGGGPPGPDHPSTSGGPGAGAGPTTTRSIHGGAGESSSVDSLAGVLSSPDRPGILSPAVLPPAASSWQFSLLPLNSSCLTWLGELFPFLSTAGTRLGAPFVLDKKHGLPLAAPAMPSAAPEFLSNGRDSKSGHGEEEPPAGSVGEAEQRGREADDDQPDCCSTIRRLFQQLVHVQSAISSSSSGSRPSDAWFNGIKHLSSDAQGSLEDLHYKLILDMLGVGRNWETKAVSNVSATSSPREVAILSITDKLEALQLGSSAIGIHSEMLSLPSLFMRCILLCRAILGITSIIARAEDTKQTPIFAFDDLTYTAHNKGAGMSSAHTSIPSRVTDPIYLLPVFNRSLLYLDLSSCRGLAQLPPSIGNLHNLSALNLSHCYSLHTLPVSLGRLKNLQILVLSCCHALRSLPVSLCELSKLRLLDLAGCSSLENLPDSLVNLSHLEILNLSDCRELMELPQPFLNLQGLKYLNLSGSHGVDLNRENLHTLANLKCVTLSPLTIIQGFPNSFRELEIRLDNLIWSKNNRVHHQCNPKAAPMHSYRCYEQSIINRILSDEADVSIDQLVTSISIMGESGMGKTELVWQIYSNQMIVENFNLRIWVYAYDKKRLLGKILEFTSCAYCTDAPISVLEEIVMEELAGKRLLLVLEDFDIKSQYFWSDVQRLLNVCAKGSALIVTTKSHEVANLVGAMQTCYLSPLSKEECFMIFKRHVVLGGFDMDIYPELKNIGWKVVEKSGGNPMCIKALSGLSCHSEIGLSETDMLLDSNLPALQLCYDLLPAHLQRCFNFCSLFPKDHIFIKHHVIRLWISQGFVLPEEGTQPEDTGLHYFDELVCRSFFHPHPFLNDGDDEFVMHELFHVLATSVSKNEYFRCEEPFCSLSDNICNLSIVLSDFKTVALANEARNLQSFLVVRASFPVVRILNSADLFVKFRFLRALNLSYTDIVELPRSIGNMKHLRLLALNNTRIKDLPFEIGQLETLQTLELKDCCQLTNLPESISNLVKLRHLDIQKEPGNVKVSMPYGIGQLTDLQTLTEFNIGNNLSQCSITELKSLNGLRGHVHVTGLENIKTADDAREANMVGKHLLEALTLEWSYSDEGMDDNLGQEIVNNILQNLQPNSNLQKLVVRNYAGSLFPLWQEPYLIKLVSITLDNCYDCSELPYLGNLPSLKSLFIQRMNSVESFGIGSNSLATAKKHPPRFPSLEVLTLWEMYDLEYWVGTSDGDFPRLRHLSISRCPKLINLPPLPSLVHLTVHCGGQVPSLSELPSLESLKIEGFHKIRSITFPDQLKMLKRLEIGDCKELSSLFAYSLSVSDLTVVRCPKLDLVGSSLDQHHGQKVVVGRNRPTRRSMVLKTEANANIHHDGWQWLYYGEKNIFGSKFPRSYYGCIQRNSTECTAMKIIEPHDTDPNVLSVMYISEHNHELSSNEHGTTTRKRKELDVSEDEKTTKRQANDFFK